MSDLQDLIATNAVRAYNEGFERGATEERERIIMLLEKQLAQLIQEMRKCDSDDAQMIAAGQVSGFQEAIKLIKGEQK